jgi:hypothetical protein
MTSQLPPDRARLLALAEAQQIDDPDVRESWPAVVTAIRGGWLLPGDGPYSIPGSIERLERTGLVSVEEYAIEEDDDDPASLLVTLIADTRRVPREAFLRELRRLDDDYRAGRGAAPDPAPPAAPDLPEPDALRRAFQDLLGAAGEAPSTPEAERVRREAHAELERLSATGDDEVRSALAGLTAPDRARMSDALRAFAEWAEQPEGRGDAVDDVIRGLEETVGRLLPGRRAEARATDARIRGSAQDAIARRLRGG